MSQNNRIPRLAEESHFSVPAKVFLLGEYAVLGGLPAVVGTLGPRFGLRFLNGEQGGDSGQPVFAANSPAGRLAARIQPPLAATRYAFEDPFAGSGGFGASTAQFALLYMALAQEEGDAEGDARGGAARGGEHRSDALSQLELQEWHTAWDLYREITADQRLPPSGADLIAQWRGGVCAFDPRGEYFQASGGSPACADLWEAFDWAGMLVFSAAEQDGRKVNTHEHLEQLSRMGVVARDRAGQFPEMKGFFSGLREPLFHGIDAIRAGDAPGMGRAMNSYADELARLGLEARATSEDRRALGRLKGVLGVKGAGAMQADAIVLLMPPLAHHDRQAAIEVAEARGLKLIADGLCYQAGASAHH